MTPFFLVHLAWGSDWLFTRSMAAYRHRVPCRELVNWCQYSITSLTAHRVEDRGAGSVVGQRVVTGCTLDLFKECLELVPEPDSIPVWFLTWATSNDL